MAKRGRRVVFHGAFGTRAAAVRKHKRVARSYVRRVRMRGCGVRFMVVTRRGKR